MSEIHEIEMNHMFQVYEQRYSTLTKFPSIEERTMDKKEFSNLKNEVSLKLDVIVMFFEHGYDVSNDIKKRYGLIDSLIVSTLKEIEKDNNSKLSRVRDSFSRLKDKVGSNYDTMKSSYESLIEEYEKDNKVLVKLINKFK